jgi:hypothetical protein
MGFPEEDMPQFPVGAARALAGELDSVANDLESMIEARAGAAGGLTEFQGGVADQFRSDLNLHELAVAGVVEDLRLAAGRLRGAIDDHHAERRRILTTLTT